MAASADTRARDVMKPKEILGDIEDPTIRSSGLELLENIIASDDKARSEAFHSKPVAKSTKAKKAAKPAARVSLECSTISSAVAVTAKKGKGKKITLSDSDDEFEDN